MASKSAKNKPPVTDEDLEAVGIGHNRPNIIGGVDTKKLKSFIERIERLEEEKAGITEDARDVFTEAKGAGLDVKAMRACIKLRKMKAEVRAEEEYQLDLYKRALGLTPEIDDTI
jgi:uncharacterized protein (UPF0335 family)